MAAAAAAAGAALRRKGGKGRQRRAIGARMASGCDRSMEQSAPKKPSRQAQMPRMHSPRLLQPSPGQSGGQSGSDALKAQAAPKEPEKQ